MLSKLFKLLLALGLMTTVAACGPSEDAEEGTMDEVEPTEEVAPAETPAEPAEGEETPGN